MRSYLTNDQLKERLHVSEDALAKFRQDPLDPLPYLRAGRRYLYVPEKVDKWAERQAERSARRGGKTPVVETNAT